VPLPKAPQFIANLDAHKLLKIADEPVSRILYNASLIAEQCVVAIIPLGRDSHRGSSSLPEGFQSSAVLLRRTELALIEPGRLSPPIWPCTTRGFPCSRYYYRDGGLLPHLFTLT
jgi:hypothetical protein